MKDMRQNIFGILLAIVAVLPLSSCDSYFDDVPSNAVTLDDVFSNRGQTLAWLINIYSFIPDNTNRYASKTAMFWGPGTLEGYLPWDWVETHNIILGTLYATTDFVERLWTQYYRGISYANTYLANVDRNDAMSESDKEWTKAECRALRAYFYFNLVKEYGPVPLVGDRIFEVDDPLSDMQIQRGTVDECFDYIISELKEVINGGHLVSQFSNGSYNSQMTGNFTQEAMEALLAETYLFRASYLFNGETYYKDLTNPDGTKLWPQERDLTKWQDARDAAKAIIDSGKFKLVLRDTSGRLVSDIKSSCPFKSVFYASMGSADNEEMIYGRTDASRETYSMIPRFEGIPSGYDKGGGAYTVPLEFLDLYFTYKGLKIEDDDTYFRYDVDDPQELPARNPDAIVQTTACIDSLTGYQYFTQASATSEVSYSGSTAIMKQFYNREPRFYHAITFQNRPWDFDKGVAVQMQFNGNAGSNGNTHDYPIFGTITRKLYYGKESTWNTAMMMRLGEVYLNYAEACAELGDLGEAIHYVNLIRQRAGVPEYYGVNAEDQTDKDAWGKDRIYLGSWTQELALKVIYRERILELAYEDKHYFDVRRWCVGDGNWRDGTTMTDGWIYPPYHVGGEGGDMHGFNVMDDGVTDDNVNVNFYKRIVQQERIYTKRMQLLPIPQTEINRVSVLVQNAGWSTDEEDTAHSGTGN